MIIKACSHIVVDNVTLELDGVLYFRCVDPFKVDSTYTKRDKRCLFDMYLGILWS